MGPFAFENRVRRRLAAPSAIDATCGASCLQLAPQSLQRPQPAIPAWLAQQGPC